MARNHGHLVCIACHGGLFAMNDYCASKFAAVGFAESIALELLVLGKEGVKTTIACPYLINTTMFAGCQTKWPSFLPVMDQHDAAEKIVDAILREKLYTLLPFSLYFLMALKSVMPTKLGIIFVNFLGSLDLMDQFSDVPVKREVGDVSILVNNAGVVTGKYNFTDAPDNLVDRTLRVNAAAHFWTYKAFLPTMMARNHGHLVCIACHGGLFAMNDYCASKFAAVGFAESIALELLVLGKEGVKTTIACPYLINTTMFAGCQTKWPSFLPVMDQHDAAEKIVDAILREKLYTLLPFSLYFLMALKSVMPTKLGIIFVNFLGSLDLMDQFSGVPVSPAASCRKTQEPAQLPKEETNLKQTAGNISEYN
ncbi:UNVERIFIED_CONTAM: hypothetical protein FKN15_012736 [Acipenser sinensis]